METKLDSDSSDVMEDSKTLKGILQKKKKTNGKKKKPDVFVLI